MVGTWSRYGDGIGTAMARINAQRVRTWTHADAVITEWARERGIDAHDEAEIRTWLVVDEDYDDGCVFTRGQIRRECEWAWRNEQRYRAIVNTIRVVCHMEGIMNEGKVKAIARNVALNADIMKV